MENSHRKITYIINQHLLLLLFIIKITSKISLLYLLCKTLFLGHF